jgi:hypothetical protein
MMDSAGFETRPNQDFGENFLKRHPHERHSQDVSIPSRDCCAALTSK